MYSKFENFMKKYLAPLADKMDKEVHLSAVKKAMVAMTPLLIIGSFCLIPEAIPNMIGKNHVISQWILTNLDIIYIPNNVGMALMSVYVTVIIAYQLANSYKLDIPGCVTMGLVSFLMLVVEFTEDGGISKTYLGPKGLLPYPYTGTVTMDVAKAVQETKAGKVTYRTDKEGNDHLPIGRVSFDDAKLVENFNTINDVLLKAKPSTAKGQYIKNISVTTTFGPGIHVDQASF